MRRNHLNAAVRIGCLSRGNKERADRLAVLVFKDHSKVKAPLSLSSSLHTSLILYSLPTSLYHLSVVRLKKAGKRFELACYKNKLLDYQNRLTQDLNQVLQIDSIFTNVSKGQLASKEDLISAFGKDTPKADIIREILAKGELQLAEKERNLMNELTLKDIAAVVADKCVDPVSRRPYRTAIIEKAMTESLHYSVHPSRTVKQQALDVIKMLIDRAVLPIRRAQMRLKIVIPLAAADGNSGVAGLMTEQHVRLVFDAKIRPNLASIEQELMVQGNATGHGCIMEITALVDPGQYRCIEEAVQKEFKGKASVCMLSLKEDTTSTAL